MYNHIIENYIKKLDKNKIIDYGIKNNIYLNNNEAEIILKIIKKDWKVLMYGNPNNIFNYLKANIREDNYIKIEDLYYKSKEKYLM